MGNMGNIIRFGISIDSKLLKNFDRLIVKKKYTSRSEAIRDLIREGLVELEWKEETRETAGAVTLVYNHDARELVGRLVDIQHQMQKLIISSVHVHLDDHHCLEVLVVRGKSKDIKKAADQLIGVKGVIHGKLTMATTGKRLT